MKFSKMQTRVLSLLLDKYENSKSYSGENKVVQNFYINPTDVYKQYDSDYEDVDVIRQFEDELSELVELELIELAFRKDQSICRIYAVKENLGQMYTALGRDEKRKIVDHQIEYYQSISSKYDVVRKFCKDQLERLENGKKAVYELGEAQKILQLCNLILGNQQDLLERELSIIAFGDTKLFEKKYRSKVCSVIQNYGEYEDILEGLQDKREIERTLLEEFQIYANPSYIYFKGKAKISFADGNEILLIGKEELALSTGTISEIVKIQIEDENIMTIENITSFNRMSCDGYFFIFLSGYHNTSKADFLKLIAKQNEQAHWFHFGDIDPDGLHIFEHLRRKTDIPFAMYAMDIEQLKKYQDYTKVLEKNDVVKAQNMILAGRNESLLQYMLDHNCKLEQEIISWKMKNGGAFYD